MRACRGVGPFIQKHFTSYFEQLREDSAPTDPSDDPIPLDPGEVGVTSA